MPTSAPLCHSLLTHRPDNANLGLKSLKVRQARPAASLVTSYRQRVDTSSHMPRSGMPPSAKGGTMRVMASKQQIMLSQDQACDTPSPIRPCVSRGILGGSTLGAGHAGILHTLRQPVLSQDPKHADSVPPKTGQHAVYQCLLRSGGTDA